MGLASRGWRNTRANLANILFTKGVLSTEIKYHTFTYSNTRIYDKHALTPILGHHMTNIAEGNLNHNRQGGKIFLRKINLKYAAHAYRSTTPSNDVTQFTANIMIVRDKHPKSSATSSSSPVDAIELGIILELINTNLITTPVNVLEKTIDYKKVYDHYQDRFEILFRRTFTMDSQPLLNRTYYTFNHIIPVYQPTWYTGSSAHDTAGPGQIYVLTWSNNDASSAYFSMAGRLSFTDV